MGAGFMPEWELFSGSHMLWACMIRVGVNMVLLQGFQQPGGWGEGRRRVDRGRHQLGVDGVVWQMAALGWVGRGVSANLGCRVLRVWGLTRTHEVMASQGKEGSGGGGGEGSC